MRRRQQRERLAALRAKEDVKYRELVSKTEAAPEWHAQLTRLWEKHPHHQASKLNWSVLSRDNFGSWSDAQKLVQALVRAICEATAQADVKGKDKDGRAESIALAVATELSKSDSEMAALLRIIVADAEGGVGSGSVLGAWATESEQKAAGVPIDGIGFQAHMNCKTVLASNGTAAVLANFRRFVDAGFHVWVTEMDVQMLPGCTEDCSSGTGFAAPRVRITFSPSWLT